MIWWLALFTFNVIAQVSSIEKYCYSSVERMQTNRARAKSILLPSDQVSEEEACLVIQMREHRRELIQSYLRNLDPSVSITYSTAETKRDPCKLKVEKIRSLQNTVIDGSLDQKPQLTQTTTTNESKDTIQITTIREFELKANLDVIKGKCNYINPNHYEISIEVRKLALPVLIGAAIPTSPQESETYSTTLSLRSGERVEMASIVKKLKGNSSEISSIPQVQIDSSNGADVEQVFLSID